jgi:hypothetical protein
MATQKQIDANRRNAARSTGPKSEEGKAVARYNAVTHGFRAHGLDRLPREDADAFQAKLDAFDADYSPANQTEARLVRQAAVLAWKLDRAERQEATLVSRLVREAVARAERDRRDRVADAFVRLLPTADDAIQNGYDRESAASLRDTIEGTADGCRELLYRWEELRNVLRRGSSWAPEDEMHAIRLSGGGMRLIFNAEVLDLVVANRMLASPEVLIDSDVPLEGPLGLTFNAGAVREARRRRPLDPAEARAALTAIVDRHMTRLHEVLIIRERDGDLGAEEIAEAAEIAGIDTSREAEQLRKYQATMQRQFIKAVETIPKLRLQELKLEQARLKLGGIRANEPNFQCPTGVSDLQIPFSFTPVLESAVDPIQPRSKNAARRARRNREKAARRYFGKG